MQWMCQMEIQIQLGRLGDGLDGAVFAWEQCQASEGDFPSSTVDTSTR